MEKLENWLKEQELLSIEHLYHFNLPPALLSPMQQEHAAECGPFYMAVETGRDWVRSSNSWSGPNASCDARASPTPLPSSRNT